MNTRVGSSVETIGRFQWTYSGQVSQELDTETVL